MFLLVKTKGNPGLFLTHEGVIPINKDIYHPQYDVIYPR